MLPKLFFTILSSLFLAHSYSDKCVDHQKSLLLELKNELIFNSSISRKLVQWNQMDDCCNWNGVECDRTGHVMSLQLDGESISGGIGNSSSLFRLMHLQKLNLARNEFNFTAIPKGIHNLNYLTHLNLSNAAFAGQVPAELSFLRRLVSLDISDDDWGLTSSLNLEHRNLEVFLSNMTGLRELYLDGVYITSPYEKRQWSHIISSYLPNLTALSLRCCSLHGPLAKSFWQLHSLSVLRLDYNNLSRVAPDLFTNFSSLTTLSLANCEMRGFFPEAIFHLPTLQNLDLTGNEQLSGNIPSFSETGSLKSIILSDTNFTGSVPSSISNLTALSKLDLSYSQFTGSIPSTFGNLTQLVYVDLSNNFFIGSHSSELFGGFPNLVYLHLGGNSFSGCIPQSLFRLPLLQDLSLFGNIFVGQLEEIPVANVSNIVSLDLSGNRLKGPIPDSFFQLHRLESLQLYGNMFDGNFQLDKIQSLANLTQLDLSDNNLSIEVGNENSSRYELPQLQALYLSSCNLHDFPNFIKHSDMRRLDLSNNHISGEIPSWIWSVNLEYLNLSLNHLKNRQRPYHVPAFLYLLDLHSNQLRGDLHLLFPPHIGNNLQVLLLANNSLSGSIPTSLCNATKLQVLDLSRNRLSGNIPICLLENCVDLNVLNLGQNNISGPIPDNFSTICVLNYLDLSNNNLEGKIPKTLQRCKELQFMNVGSNIIKDTFPCMMSSSLAVLVLHSNRFYGEVKCQTSWPRLQILDISSNNFSGTLESMNFSSWRAMMVDNDAQFRNYHKVKKLYDVGFNLLQTGTGSAFYTGVVGIIMKGLYVQLGKIFPDFIAIDLSCNNFGGGIPFSIGDLSSLRLLNLSHNNLNRSIPKSIDHLRVLESLDLSQNSLTGAIPEELAVLTFLSVLNLSHNKLIGNIPNGRQLQTFPADSFKGNPGLCGFNLNISCTHHADNNTGLSHENDKEKREIEWDYVSAALGYVVGLGSIVWLLLFCRSFRHKYFKKLDDVVEGILNARDMMRRKRSHASARIRAVMIESGDNSSGIVAI